MSRPPELSTIVITPDRFDAIRDTVAALAVQTVAASLELIIVAPSTGRLNVDQHAVSRFATVKLVEAGPIASTGEAVAVGIRTALAPLVVYVEEHAYPDPEWAAALIEAHRGPWVAVGGALANANPDSAVSWSSMLTDFAPWIDPPAGGETGRLPAHNTVYKRAALEAYGPELGAMLESETVLFEDLVARGHRLFLEPRAVTHHVNVSSVRSYALSEWLGGRLYAAKRAETGAWSALRRGAYCAAAPLIPAVRLWRLRPHIRRCRRIGNVWPRILPSLLLGLAAHTAGEVIGYLRGTGGAAARRTSVELQRFHHVRPGDRVEG